MKTPHILLLAFSFFYSSQIYTMFNLSSDNPNTWIEQPKSLKAICIEKISSTLLDIPSYDMEKEEEHLKECLEILPEELQHDVIRRIDVQLDPWWTKNKLNIRFPFLSTTTREIKNLKLPATKNFVFYHYSSYLNLIDFESNPSISISIPCDYFIEKSILSSDASLFATSSRFSIDIFSLKMPIQRIQTIQHPNQTNLVLSGYESPTLFVVDEHNKLSIYSDICSNNFTRKEYNFPQPIEVQHLALAPNNKFLVATNKHKNQHSYIINLEHETPTFQPIPLSISNPCIAEDSSFFATILNTPIDSPSTSIIFKKSGRTHLIDGHVIAIKDNYIFTRLKEDTINVFNVEGVLQHAYQILGKVNSPEINNLYFYTNEALYTLQTTNIKDLKKLIYRIAHKKAHKQKNVTVLKKLAQEPSTKILAQNSIKAIAKLQTTIVQSLKKNNNARRPKNAPKIIRGTKELKHSQHNFFWEKEKEE